MSVHSGAVARKHIADIIQHKNKTPLVALTAYTAPTARLADPHVDILLVGDSLGMVLYGLPSTLQVTLDMMIAHGRAVVNHSKQACVIVDMPFGSYQSSPAIAFMNAARVLQETGCTGIKLEGGIEMADTIAFLVARGIPVMGHVALTPQSFNLLGYRFQGRNDAERTKIMRDAKAVSEAGAFAIVLEGTEETLAREITATLPTVTIGIGASVACDGQILVSEDMLGLTPSQPRFVKTYADLADTMEKSFKDYAQDVRKRRFPAKEHCYFISTKGAKK